MLEVYWRFTVSLCIKGGCWKKHGFRLRWPCQARLQNISLINKWTGSNLHLSVRDWKWISRAKALFRCLCLRGYIMFSSICFCMQLTDNVVVFSVVGKESTLLDIASLGNTCWFTSTYYVSWNLQNSDICEVQEALLSNLVGDKISSHRIKVTNTTAIISMPNCDSSG